MNDLLQQAIEGLEIQDVYQRSLVAVCAKDFEPKYYDFDELETQFIHLVRRSELLETENEDEEDGRKVFRVIIALGVRWVPVSGEDEGEEIEFDEDEELARIETRMVAEYLLKNDSIPNEALNEFAKRNASFHVWPYWREIVSTQCIKMNLPQVFLPTVQFASNCKDEPKTENKDSK